MKWLYYYLKKFKCTRYCFTKNQFGIFSKEKLETVIYNSKNIVFN